MEPNQPPVDIESLAPPEGAAARPLPRLRLGLDFELALARDESAEGLAQTFGEALATLRRFPAP